MSENAAQNFYNNKKSSPMRYRAEIDGLRAVAVVPVILFHAGFETFPGGFIGVDIFFVISGYLITTIILSELNEERFSIIGFYERRARRILPALFLVMFACLPFAWFWLMPEEMKDFSRSLAAVSLFVSNIWFWQTSGYFETSAELKPLLHTWSLGVEEQYYLFFPLFLMIAWRFSSRWLLEIFAVLAVVSLAAAQWGSFFRPEATFYLLPTRGWELLIGALAAFYFLKATPSYGKAASEAGGAIGLLLLVYAIFEFDKQTPSPSLYTLIPTIGTALIILFASQRTLAGRLLGHRLFVGIGLVSYSAYLWHQPLFAFARTRTAGDPHLMLMGGLALGSFALAYLSWKYVEQPFRGKKLLGRAALFKFSVAGSFLFIVIGVGGTYTAYASIRFGGDRALDFARLEMNVVPRINCVQDARDVEPTSCVVGSSNGAHTIVAVGDSHIAQWSDALNVIGLESNVKIVIYSKAGCAGANIADYYFWGLQRNYWECRVWREKVISELAQSKADAILIATSSAGYVRFDGHPPTIDDWKTGVQDFVEKISRRKTKVFWLIDNPRYEGYDPYVCFEHYYLRGENRFDGCEVARKSAVNEAIVNAERAALGKVENVSFIDLTDLYCDKNVCRSMVSNIPVMRDSNHLTRAATLLFREKLARQLLQSP